jgi:hypothetical protein
MAIKPTAAENLPAELIPHAADLCSDSAGLVHDNERRWRTFRQRVSEIAAASQGDAPG